MPADEARDRAQRDDQPERGQRADDGDADADADEASPAHFIGSPRSPAPASGASIAPDNRTPANAAAPLMATMTPAPELADAEDPLEEERDVEGERDQAPRR